MGQLVFQTNGGGQVNLVGPTASSASTFNINVPSVNGNVVTTGDTGTVSNTMLANSNVVIGNTTVSLGATVTSFGNVAIANAVVTSGTINGTTIGGTTPSTGAFTTLSASSTISGTGFSTYLASPPAIGGTTPAAVTATNSLATGGFYAKGTMSASYTDGIVVDYTSTLGRISTGTADALAFYNGGVGTTELMRLDASGNLGIGTSSPTFSSGGGIHVNVAGAGPSLLHMTTGNQGTASNNGLDIKFGAGDTTFWNYANGIMAFATNNAERMRIDTSGNLLVGTTSLAGVGISIYSQANNNGIGRADFNKSYSGNATGVNFAYNGTGVGSIAYSNTAVAYNTSSDYRLKENVQLMTGALATVAQLKPVTYDWIADKSKGQGFIAHELQAVVPDCVTGEKDAVDAEGKPIYQGIDTSFLVATLTAAIQEQQAIITSQAATITDMQAKLKAAGVAGF